MGSVLSFNKTVWATARATLAQENVRDRFAGEKSLGNFAPKQSNQSDL